MRCDFHVHSRHSFDCALELDTIVKRAKKAGLDAVLIANHNTVVPPEELERCQGQGVVLLPGAEYSTDVGHVLAIFGDRPLEDLGLRLKGKVYDHREVIEAVHQMGGAAVLAHPFAHGRTPAPEALARFDGLELCNSRAGYVRKGEANPMAARALLPSQLATAGSDAHLACEIGRSYVELDCPPPYTRERVLAALRGGGTLHSKPTAPWTMAVSQVYKAFRLKQYGIIPKNLVKFCYGLACRLFPRLFGVRPYRR